MNKRQTELLETLKQEVSKETFDYVVKYLTTSEPEEVLEDREYMIENHTEEYSRFQKYAIFVSDTCFNSVEDYQKFIKENNIQDVIVGGIKMEKVGEYNEEWDEINAKLSFEMYKKSL